MKKSEENAVLINGEDHKNAVKAARRAEAILVALHTNTTNTSLSSECTQVLMEIGIEYAREARTCLHIVKIK